MADDIGDVVGIRQSHEFGVQTTVKRLDTLEKLYRMGKIDGQALCAGMDYLRIVEDYFRASSPFSKVTEIAGEVGGVGDPIARYLKARPVRRDLKTGRTTGYISTQKPRRPAPERAHSDGWSDAKLDAMASFSRVVRVVQALPCDRRRVVCLLIVDPSAPSRPAMTLAQCSVATHGYQNARTDRRVVTWLCNGLAEIDQELFAARREAA